MLSQKTGSELTRGRFTKAALVSVWISLESRGTFTDPVFAVLLELFLKLADLFLEAVDLFGELRRREFLAFVIAGAEGRTPPPAERTRENNRDVIRHLKHRLTSVPYL